MINRQLPWYSYQPRPVSSVTASCLHFGRRCTGCCCQTFLSRSRIYPYHIIQLRNVWRGTLLRTCPSLLLLETVCILVTTSNYFTDVTVLTSDLTYDGLRVAVVCPTLHVIHEILRREFLARWPLVVRLKKRPSFFSCAFVSSHELAYLQSLVSCFCYLQKKHSNASALL